MMEEVVVRQQYELELSVRLETTSGEINFV